MSGFFHGVRVIIGFILYLPVHLFVFGSVFRCIQAALNNTRGTNVVTRYVKNVRSNTTFKNALAFSSLGLLDALICAAICGFGIYLLMLVPDIGLLIMSIVMQYKSNQNKQRIKDARTVTKGGLKTTAAVASVAAKPVEMAGKAAMATGYGMGVGAALVAGGTALGAAGNVLDRAGDSMTDVSAVGVTKEDLQPIVNALPIGQYNAIGLPGNTIEEVGQNALKMPSFQLLLEEKGLPATVENVMPFVTQSVKAVIH